MKTFSPDIFRRLAAQSRSERLTAAHARRLTSATKDSAADPGASNSAAKSFAA